jgi:surface carbohydrate biosynthesis protein
MRSKVVLIVDNPIRDLEGMVLIAHSLAARGVDVFLISMNEIYLNNARDIWQISPDFILVNYIRNNNKKFIERFINANIKIGLLDTEGGVLPNLKVYKNLIIDDKNILGKINVYFSWGNKLAKYLIESSVFSNQQIVVSGSPRFDFYSKDFVKFHRPSKLFFNNENPIVLINCNFPIANPKFQTKEQEKLFLVNVLKFPIAQVEQMISFQEKALNEFIDLTMKLSIFFPDVNFLVRPHPFECEIQYQDKLTNFSNVFISKEGPVINQILISKCIIHRGCSTALEAQLMGKPAISVRWVEMHAEQPIPESVSLKVDNFNELTCLINSILNKDDVNDREILSNIQNIENDWFYKFDGKAHKRVSSEILNLIKITGCLNRKTISIYLRKSLHYSIKERLRGLVFLILGISEGSSFSKRNFLKEESLTFTDKFKLFIIYLLNISKNNTRVKNPYLHNKYFAFLSSEKVLDFKTTSEILGSITELFGNDTSEIRINYFSDNVLKISKHGQ